MRKNMKRLLLLSLSLMAYLAVIAGGVTEEQALQKALQFMQGKQFKQKNLRRAPSAEVKNNAYYVFNVENNGGFVIVSGDDRTDEILGYSDKGNIDFNNMPENMRCWLEGYAEEILSIDEGRSLNKIRRKARRSIEPLIQTNWNQREPYNGMCPEINGQHCVTGCVPTAFAQIMYYYKWPKSTLPAIEGYKSTFMDVPEIGETSFKWNKMKLSYGNDYSQEEADAVAELMRYCGQSLNTIYNLESSTTFYDYGSYISRGKLSDCFTNVFGYNVNTAVLNRSSFQTVVWENYIYNEISEGRPVLYSGQDNEDEHAFICDGYDENGLFHINWGWGSFGGYYVLSILNPNGSSDDRTGYSRYQNAVIGIRPAKETDVPLKFNRPMLEPVAADGGIVKRNNAIKYHRDSTSDNFCDIAISKCFYNLSDYSFEGQFGLALFQNNYDNSSLVSIVEEFPLNLDSYNVFQNVSKVSFGANLPNGLYLLSMIAKRKESEEWFIPSPGMCYVDIKDDSLFIFHTDNYNENQFVIHNVEVDSNLVVDEPARIEFDYTNIGNSSQILLELFENGICLGDFYFHADPGQRKSESIFYTPITNGKNKVELKGHSISWGSSLIPGYVYWEDSLFVYSNKELVFQPVKIRKGIEGKVSMSLNDPKYKLNKFCFEVHLPEGLTIYTNDDNIRVNQIDGIPYYIIEKVKNENEEYDDLVFEIRADSLMNNGKYTITFEKITCVTIDGDSLFLLPANLIIDVCRPINVETAGKLSDYIKEKYSICELILNGEINGTDLRLLRDMAGNNYLGQPSIGQLKVLDMSDTRIVPGGDLYLDTDDIHGESWGWHTGSYHYGVDNSLNLPYWFTCSNLSTIYLPQSISDIGEWAFADVLSLMDIRIPNGVENIRHHAFWYCNKLESVKIPTSVNFIDYLAFGNCFSLSKVVVCNETPFAIDTSAFSNIDSNATLIVPRGSKVKYQEADVWKDFVNIEEHDFITVKADDISTLVGKKIPSFTYKVEGGTLEGEPSFYCEADTTKLGTYEIKLRQGTVSNNYVIFENGTLTVLSDSGIRNNIPNNTLSDVYNILGRKVSSGKISLEGLPHGVYIIGGRKIVK